MGKEIERKWLLNPDVDITNLLKRPSIIKDFYFNHYCRLRCKDNKWFITIKGEGTLVRDEFEFELDKSQIYFIPSPMLKKKRYKVLHDTHEFEINIFEDLKLGQYPLTIIELELNDANEQINLPEWVGNEITEHRQFYGYNLFEMIRKIRNNDTL